MNCKEKFLHKINTRRNHHIRRPHPHNKGSHREPAGPVPEHFNQYFEHFPGVLWRTLAVRRLELTKLSNRGGDRPAGHHEMGAFDEYSDCHSNLHAGEYSVFHSAFGEHYHT